MTLVIGALTIGLILSVLSLGIYISFRIFDFPDITAEGSITLGAAVAAALLVSGVNPFAATAAAFCAGLAAGALTGVLHTKLKINGLLSGILVMTALYSVNLHVMGKSNVPLLSSTTLGNYAEDAARALGMSAGGTKVLPMFKWASGCWSGASPASLSERHWSACDRWGLPLSEPSWARCCSGCSWPWRCGGVSIRTI